MLTYLINYLVYFIQRKNASINTKVYVIYKQLNTNIKCDCTYVAILLTESTGNYLI